METGKTTKYFKYAIGEILLVVIGILIALQVSNWNEQKNSIKQTNIYLNDLKNEIQTNIMIMDNSLGALKKMQKIVNESHTLLLTDNPENISEAHINKIILDINPVQPFKPLQVVLNDFINSGNIKNIQDSKLKHNIPQLESVYHVFFNEFNSGNNHLNTTVFQYMTNHSDLTKTRISIGDFKVRQSPFNHDNEAFVNNRDFSNQLILYLGYLNRIETVVKEKKGFLENLNEDINNYLK